MSIHVAHLTEDHVQWNEALRKECRDRCREIEDPILRAQAIQDCENNCYDRA